MRPSNPRWRPSPTPWPSMPWPRTRARTPASGCLRASGSPARPSWPAASTTRRDSIRPSSCGASPARRSSSQRGGSRTSPGTVAPSRRFATRPLQARRPPARPALGRGGSFALVLRTQPRLRGVLLGLGLVHVGMIAGFTFLALRLLQLGGQASDVALSAGLSAVAEIPAMAIIPRIVARTGSRALLVARNRAVRARHGVVGVPRRPDAHHRDAAAQRRGLCRDRDHRGDDDRGAPPGRAPGHRAGALPDPSATGSPRSLANSVGGLVYGSGGAMPLFLGCAVLAVFGALVAWRSVPSRAAPATMAARQEG